MRSSTPFALFAGAAAAQSMSVGPSGANSAAVFNLFEYAQTLTLVASDATATTYKNDCSRSAGLPPMSSPDSASAQVTPAPTPRALRARQTVSDSPDSDDASLCEPYTIKQGASTWEMHLTDPSPGVWTVDMNCSWKGTMTAADFTCTATVDGNYVEKTDRGTTTTTMPSGSVSEFGAINTVTVLGASGAAASGTPLSSGASPSASGSNASGSGAARSGSGTASPTPSTGFAPTRPLPTGAMALVGGAAGVFAAALAL